MMQTLDNNLFIVAVIVTVMQLVVYIKKLGIKAILHPGSLFALIWLMSSLSQFLLIQIDLALIYEPYFINEINIFVIFSSLFFIFWIAVNPYNSYFGRKQFTFNININSLKLLLKITLIGAFLIMLYTWYKLGVSSLNIAEIRNLNTSDKNNYIGTSSDLILSLLRYTQFFYPILTILMGYYLGVKFLAKKKIPIPYKYLYIPLIISLFYVLSNGGRNPALICLKLYLIGLCFAFPSVITKSDRTFIYKRILYLFLALILFSTFVNDSRRSFSKSDAYSNNFDSPILKFLSGIIEYTGAHYYGYQLRNIDTFDENKLGYGYFTFNSLFNVKLPFSSHTGIKTNLGNLLGFDDNPIDYFYLWENEREGYFTTNSVYLDLKLDFGFYGAILFLFLFTRYTHRLFLKSQTGQGISLYFIMWFYFCFDFWASSNFKSSYAYISIPGTLIMMFLFSKIATRNKI